MASPHTYSYYFGLGVAIILGYVISSLRIEIRIIGVITMLSERMGRTSAKKRMIQIKANELTESEESFQQKNILSGWDDKNIFELERRAIFSKACDFTAQRMQNSDKCDSRLGFLLPMHHGSRKQVTTEHTTSLVSLS
jgi:hypothetical protein